jgi:hypoxanthine phosphoribosyltransferase
VKRIFKGPWLWIVLSAFAVLLAIQFLAPSDGYDEVNTSTLASYIDDGKVDEITFIDGDQEIQATLDKGTREDGDKVVAYYIQGRHVLVVDEIIDTGLTLSWLVSNLASRGPKSVAIATLLRKPDALAMPVDVKYVGWDIANEFVVGYGLDYNEKYRNLRDIGTLAPHVYS